MTPISPSSVRRRRLRHAISGLIPVLALSVLAACAISAHAAPPYSGTAFIAPDLITQADPTKFVGIVDRGLQSRNVFDRRIGDYVIMDVFVYDTLYLDGHEIGVFADQCGSKRTFWGSAGRKLAMTLSLR